MPQRIQLTKDHIDLANSLKRRGVMPSDRAILTTHVGFFDRPEKKQQIKDSLKRVLTYCNKRDVYLAIETGSEPMQNLVEFIREVEYEVKEAAGFTGRLGINYDPANFYLYGTQDPLVALNFLKGPNSKYLFGVHIKDALKDELQGVAMGDWKGKEVAVGTGSVLWEPTIAALHELGYTGPLIIERENPQPDGMPIETHRKLRMETIQHAKLNIQIAQREYLVGQGQEYIPFS